MSQSTDEGARLEALRSFRILDSEPEPAFDELTRLAARLFQVPMAVVGLLDQSRQWFKSRIGIDRLEIDRDLSLCRPCCQNRRRQIVEDTLADESLRSHPLVTGPPGVRFLAAAPLITRDGFALGSLCVLDTRPRPFPEAEAGLLESLARQVVAQIELRRWRLDSADQLGRLMEGRPGPFPSGEEAEASPGSRLLELVLENLPVGVWITDATGQVLLTNAAAARIGWEGGDGGAPLSSGGEEVLGRALRGMTTQERSREMVGPDGRTRTIAASGAPIRDPGRRILGAILVGEDVTGRREAEAQTRRSLSLLRAALESTADGILVVDTSGRIVDFNRRFAEMWGIPDAILASREDERALAYVLRQLRDPEGFRAKVQGLYALPEAESFDVLEFNDGRIFERFSRPQRLGDACVGRVWSFRDVTAARRSESELRASRDQLFQSQKMEAVGRLAGGVAHDFNNLLTAVNGYSDLLLRRLGDANPGRAEVTEIRKAGERAAALTRQLLAFSRKQALHLRPLDLNEVVRDIDRMLRRLIGEDIELTTRLTPGLGRILADQGQIEQIIVNLVVNARDAMPHGGAMVLETFRHPDPSGPSAAGTDAPAGVFVGLAIRDNGLGMERATLTRLFEPYFTTKEAGKGTGLGLSTVRGILDQYGGAIRVESAPGRGSTFRIFVPCTEERGDDTPVGSAGLTAPTNGRETILVVEDEHSVRLLVRAVLQDRGYQVLEAGDSHEALAILERPLPEVQLLVADVVLPRMNGRELFERARAFRRDLKVIYMSGYSENAVAKGGVVTPGTPFLPKPFEPEALTRKVREVLDGAMAVRGE